MVIFIDMYFIIESLLWLYYELLWDLESVSSNFHEDIDKQEAI